MSICYIDLLSLCSGLRRGSAAPFCWPPLHCSQCWIHIQNKLAVVGWASSLCRYMATSSAAPTIHINEKLDSLSLSGRDQWLWINTSLCNSIGATGEINFRHAFRGLFLCLILSAVKYEDSMISCSSPAITMNYQSSSKL